MAVVTYVPDFQIILTRRSMHACGYCNFQSTPACPPPSRKQIIRDLRTATRLGCTQVTITAGELIDELPEIVSVCRYYGFKSWYDYLFNVCQMVLKYNDRNVLFPRLDVGPIPYCELRKLRPVLPVVRLMLQSADDSLQEKPAHMNAPHMTLGQRMSALEDLGRLEIPTVTGIRIGIDESRESWALAARSVSQMNSKYGHIQSFVLMPFYPAPYSAMSKRAPVSEELFIQALKVVRANLDQDIVLGAELQNRTCLLSEAARHGVTDIGGVVHGTSEKINFDVSSELEMLQAEAEKAGIKLCQRMPFFENFLQRQDVPPNVRQRVQKMKKVAPKTYLSEDSAAACM